MWRCWMRQMWKSCNRRAAAAASCGGSGFMQKPSHLVKFFTADLETPSSTIPFQSDLLLSPSSDKWSSINRTLCVCGVGDLRWFVDKAAAAVSRLFDPNVGSLCVSLTVQESGIQTRLTHWHGAADCSRAFSSCGSYPTIRMMSWNLSRLRLRKCFRFGILSHLCSFF